MLSWLRGTSAPVDVANQEIDLNTTVFNPENPAHRALMTKRLDAFQLKLQELWYMDKIYGAAITGEILLCFSGVANFILGMAGMCALLYTAYKVNDRAKYQTEFDKVALELYQVYQWSAKQGPVMTHDGQFQAMAKALLVCTLDYQQLLPWDLSKPENQILSRQFLTILAESPHRIKMIFNGQDASAVKLPIWLQPAEAAANQLAAFDPRQLANNRWAKFFTDTAAHGKLTWYGKDFAALPAP